MHDIEMIPYEPSLAGEFARLNLAWIRKYFTIEPKDEEVFEDPERYIINKGGFIFFAVFNGKIAGTFALLKVNDGVFELGKMAVEESCQDKKIGNAMLAFCVQQVKQVGAGKVLLYSNTKLAPAIHLYKKFGFNEVPLEGSEYKRSDIKMELEINK